MVIWVLVTTGHGKLSSLPLENTVAVAPGPLDVRPTLALLTDDAHLQENEPTDACHRLTSQPLLPKSYASVGGQSPTLFVTDKHTSNLTTDVSRKTLQCAAIPQKHQAFAAGGGLALAAALFPIWPEVGNTKSQA